MMLLWIVRILIEAWIYSSIVVVVAWHLLMIKSWMTLELLWRYNWLILVIMCGLRYAVMTLELLHSWLGLGWQVHLWEGISYFAGLISVRLWVYVMMGRVVHWGLRKRLGLEVLSEILILMRLGLRSISVTSTIELVRTKSLILH